MVSLPTITHISALIMKKYLQKNLGLLCLGLLVGIILSEIILRILFLFEGYPLQDKFYTWIPNQTIIFKPLKGIMPGVNREARFRTNYEGIRGDDFSHSDQYKILVIGGSSAECLYLDQYYSWPYLLQEKLNADGRHHIWVGNAAKSGLNSRMHILQMRYLLPQYPDIDAVIILAGVNDLLMRCAEDIYYDPHFLDKPQAEKELLRWAFEIVPQGAGDATISHYRMTAIWKFFTRIKNIYFHPGIVQDSAGEWYIGVRQNRQNASNIRIAMPDLGAALEEYRRNINTIVDMGRQRSLRVIFCTQPVLWRADLPEHLNALLWMGGVGNFMEESGKEYYSAEALAAGMDKYNDALKQVCRERGVEYIDLAAMIPKDGTAFYDDCHLNEGGSEKVAEIIFHYMEQHQK